MSVSEPTEQKTRGRRPEPTYGDDQSEPEQNCFSAEDRLFLKEVRHCRM